MKAYVKLILSLNCYVYTVCDNTYLLKLLDISVARFSNDFCVFFQEGYLTDEERPYRNYLAIIAPDSYERRSEHSVEHSADLDRSQRSTEYDRSSSRNNNDGSNIGERRSYCKCVTV